MYLGPKRKAAAPKQVQKKPPKQSHQKKAPKQSHQKKAPTTQGQKKAPTKQGQKKAPTKQGQKKAPTKQGQKKAPTKQGQKKAPTTQGQKKAPTKQGQKKAPTKQGQKKAPTTQGQKKAPTKQGQKKAPTKQGQKKAPKPVKQAPKPDLQTGQHPAKRALKPQHGYVHQGREASKRPYVPQPSSTVQVVPVPVPYQTGPSTVIHNHEDRSVHNAANVSGGYNNPIVVGTAKGNTFNYNTGPNKRQKTGKTLDKKG